MTLFGGAAFPARDLFQTTQFVSSYLPAMKSGSLRSGGFCPASVVIVQQALSGQVKKCRVFRMTDDSTHQREHGAVFMPRFDASGLLTAVALDSGSGEVLMVAFMDAEALVKTRETGLAHFHSRSRGRLWMKGESSGHVLEVQDILVDCDQDAVVLKVIPKGPTCHTGARSCFYRRLDGEGLVPITD
ncbi:MAG: phosphoribosyl-AMP cyclohydrolase [Novosphingobium sp.]